MEYVTSPWRGPRVLLLRVLRPWGSYTSMKSILDVSFSVVKWIQRDPALLVSPRVTQLGLLRAPQYEKVCLWLSSFLHRSRREEHEEILPYLISAKG